ncbi:TonB-dependent receptor [Sandarakinorhabdus rubra]|uniref:TonB-dependent receptor n=1 Tax=Sandarakinorhabdus rubra TaxID=2672568 RepID=UPI0013D97533|nr:TonB-dependent receptor [Sandarakinorhabdus rubra]
MIRILPARTAAVRIALLASLGATPVMAQTLASAEAGATADVVVADDQQPTIARAGETTTADDGEIIVSGQRPIRESERAALQVQKNSDQLVSVLSADSVGRLPDQNIAQAVSRLPGVAVQRDQGQARYVNLRGSPLNWTTLSFDGINVISPEGRDARFDSIPSAIATQVIVRKAVTPDMTAETIAGNINVITRSAFDYAGLHVQARGGIGYVDLGGGKEYEATGVISDRWSTGIGEIGAVLSGSFYERTMATDNMETDWETVSRDLRPVGTNEDPRGLIDTPNGARRVWARETENKLYRLTRRNYSVSGRLEWAPDNDNKLFVTSIYSAFTDNELRSNYIFDLDDQESRVPNLTTPCTSSVLAPNTTGYADACVNSPYVGTVYGVDLNANLLSREFLQSVFINTIGGDHKTGAWTISWRGNYTRSRDDRSFPAQLNYESPSFGSNGANATNRLTVAYDLTDPQLTRVALFRTLRAADGTLSRGERVGNITDFPQSLTRIRSQQAVDTTEAYTARLDLSVDTSLFGDTKFSFGGQYDNRVKEVDERLLDVNGSSTFNGQNVFTAANVPLSPLAVSIPGNYIGQLPLGYSFPYFGKQNIIDVVKSVEPFASYVFNNSNYYKVREKVYSAYAMGVTKMDWGSIVYGARFEHVENKATAFRAATSGGAPTVLNTINRSFTQVYPSVHVNWNAAPDMKVRLSFNTGAARPDYPVLRPNFTFNDPNQTISGGNPDAVPEKTRGVDLYWEYYPSRGGFFMVGAYYKDVRDVLFGSTRQFGSDELNFDGVDRSVYNFSTTLNGGSGKVYGAEAAAQLQLDNFLSEDHWWGGFGIQTNASFNRSEAITPDGRKVRFPGTSDFVLNVGPYYEKYGFSARVSFQYRSSWIDSLGEPGVGGDFFWAPDGELDISARYAITKNFEIYTDISNVLNGPGRRFVGNAARTIERETFGRRYTAGLRVTY